LIHTHAIQTLAPSIFDASMILSSPNQTKLQTIPLVVLVYEAAMIPT